MSSYAVIVGINHYMPPEKKGLESLHGAIQDATDFYTWVTTKGGVPTGNCELILSMLDPDNPKPMKHEVDKAIVRINDKVIANDNKNADRLYFYFAGHGLGVELDRYNNGMCMADWNESERNTTALSSKAYERKFLNEGLFKEVVLFMDCCRNTKVLFQPGESSGIMQRGPNNEPKWIVGYATQYQNQAFESSTGSTEIRGIFTRVLLDGLNGAASKDGGKTITARNLIDHIYYNVQPEAEKAGFIQKPDIPNNIDPATPFYFIQNQ